MEIKTNAKLLTAKGTPYDFNGTKGVSFKLRFLVVDEVYTVKTTQKVVEDLKERLFDDGVAVFNLGLYQKVLSLSFVSFS